MLGQPYILRHRMFVKPTFNCGAAIDRTFCEITPLTGLLGGGAVQAVNPLPLRA